MNPKPRASLAPQERQAVAELHRLLNEPGLLRASFIHMKRSCGRDYCRCRTSKKHWHASWYVVQRHRGRPRMKHVPSELREAVEQWIERYHRAKELLNTVSDVYWEALKKKR